MSTRGQLRDPGFVEPGRPGARLRREVDQDLAGQIFRVAQAALDQRGRADRECPDFDQRLNFKLVECSRP